MDPDVKTQMVKSVSANLCSAVSGQVFRLAITPTRKTSIRMTAFYQKMIVIVLAAVG